MLFWFVNLYFKRLFCFILFPPKRAFNNCPTPHNPRPILNQRHAKAEPRNEPRRRRRQRRGRRRHGTHKTSSNERPVIQIGSEWAHHCRAARRHFTTRESVSFVRQPVKGDHLTIRNTRMRHKMAAFPLLRLQRERVRRGMRRALPITSRKPQGA